jgi:hypothetical protein
MEYYFLSTKSSDPIKVSQGFLPKTGSYHCVFYIVYEGSGNKIKYLELNKEQLLNIETVQELLSLEDETMPRELIDFILNDSGPKKEYLPRNLNSAEVHLDFFRDFQLIYKKPSIEDGEVQESDSDDSTAISNQVNTEVNTNTNIVVPQPAPVNNTIPDEFDNLILLQDAVKYDGFSPKKLRANFIGNKNNDTIARDLIMCFTAYSSIGNNVNKLQSKRHDLELSRSLVTSLNTLGVKYRTSESNGFTLPRIAISFMPEYVIYRKFFAKDLQNQTSSNLEIPYKDIIFYGCDQIRNMTNYNIFHKEFSAMIMKKGITVDMNDDKIKAIYDRWNNVSIAGYQSDTGIHANMVHALGLRDMTAQSAFIQIRSNMTGYKNE